jgi:aminoglycoside phosphotransferase family enzyme/predicted kinase
MAANAEPVSAARTRIDALRLGLEKLEGMPVRLIETHISWVLLGQALAWKLKKPLALPFLDFSTPGLRRHFCEEELRLNRRLAPQLYLDVVDVCDGPAGPSFGGAGTVVDAALRMRRFPDGALWSEQLAAGRLEVRHVDAMAGRLAEFHQGAPIAPAQSHYGSASAHEEVVSRLADTIDTWQPGPGGGDGSWPALRGWLRGQVQVLAPHWEERRLAGRIRECHGDLHLDNVVQLAKGPVAFDAIEFDPALRWIDVFEDVAFLVMDLLAHRRRDLAFNLLNAWLEAMGDYAGLPTLRFFLVSRALVRAVVSTLRHEQGISLGGRGGADDYLHLATEISQGSGARLAITHGLPGSGKTFVSQKLIGAAGAIRVRSDVERKRLFGLAALESSERRTDGGGIYDPAAGRRTYDRLLDVSRLSLTSGLPVVVDAAFLRREERDRFAALAGELNVPFSIFDCKAPRHLLSERIVQRQAGGVDASEADLAVLERLERSTEPLDSEEKGRVISVDTGQPLALEALARRWLADR